MHKYNVKCAQGIIIIIDGVGIQIDDSGRGTGTGKKCMPSIKKLEKKNEFDLYIRFNRFDQSINR